MNQENKTNSSPEIKAAQELNEMLSERVSKLKKSIRTDIIVGSSIALFVIIYMSVLFYKFNDALKPDLLADAITAEVTSRIPQLGSEVENQLKAKAPEIVGSLKTMVISESMPALREALEKYLLEVFSEFSKTAPQVLNQEIYADLVKQNKAKIRGAIQNKAALADPNFTAALEKQLAGEIEKQKAGKQIMADLNQSITAIKVINAKLDQIKGKKGLTKKESLIQQLISGWWTMFEPDTDYKITKEDEDVLKKTLSDSAKELFQDAKNNVPK